MKPFRKHVVIVGTARSGTSWLSETLAKQYRYRMLYEPEHESKTKNGYLICDQWLKDSTVSSETHRYLGRIFANRIDCDWIAQNSNRKFKQHLWPFIPKKYIIKFVRANLSAKYLNEYFEIPVIHMIRNPYEVLFSQLRANFPWLVDLKIFAEQNNLAQLIEEVSGFDIKDYQRLSKLQILALRWCVENVIPLEVWEHYSYKSQVVRYEDLYQDIGYFYKLCETFKLNPIGNIEEIYRLPSTKTHHKSTIKTKAVQQQLFSSSEFEEINYILDAFQTKLYPRRH